MTLRKARLIMFSSLGLAALLGGLWWALFGLKPYDISAAELQARYTVPASAAAAPALQPLPAGSGPGHGFDVQFSSFDGDRVIGRLVFPSDPSQAQRPFPLLIAMHGLGRTQLRWWHGDFKGRPTLEQTHRITKLALAKGWAVLALDARRHGARDPGFAASSLLTEMKLWGRRAPYEQMIIDTVRDYRYLLDWVLQQPTIDADRVQVTGYSMGAQMALLLAAADHRVHAVAAMVPPHLDGKVAAVAPALAASGLAGKRVWLLSADKDDYASPAQNTALFDAIPSANKKHLRFESGHLLPADYVSALQDWL